MTKRLSLSSFRTDPVLEREGVWCLFATGDVIANPDDPMYKDDLIVRIARIGNPRYQAALVKLGKTTARTGQTVTVEQVDIATRDAVARNILLDWRNLYDTPDSEEQTTYSLQKCREIINNEEYRDFYERVLLLARDADNYRREEDRDDAGE